MTIVGFSLVIATGKTFGEELDPNQELLALGVANALGGCVCCYPASVTTAAIRGRDLSIAPACIYNYCAAVPTTA